MEAYDKLLNEGDYTRKQKAGNSFAEKISGPYYADCLYLPLLEFQALRGISWIIWPIAGVLYGLIAAVSASVLEAKQD